MSKAVALLTAFAPDRPTMGVSEIARRAGVPKSTAFRLLAVLESWGFVERQGPLYALGQRLVELGSLVANSRHQGLRDAALPYLEDLYELTHETVHLGVLDGTDVFYVEKLYGHDAAKAPSQVGGRLPANCSALGKAMLAFHDADVVRKVLSQPRRRTPYTIITPSVFVEELRAIRTSGVAFDHEEARIGIGCAAAPIFDASGTVVAAVSVTGPTRRFNPQNFASAVRQASLKIAAELRRR